MTITVERAPTADQMPEGRHILVVDDDRAVCGFIVQLVEGLGVPCCCTVSLDQTRRYPDLGRVALVILDLSLGGGDAVDILEYLANQDYAGGVSLITGFDAAVLDPVQTFGTMLGLSMWPAMIKPLRPADLRRAIQSIGA